MISLETRLRPLLRRRRYLDLQQLRRVAAEDRRLVGEAELGARDEAHGIGRGHIEGVVAAEQEGVAAPGRREILELVVSEDDRVEIELLQIARRLLRGGGAAVGACLVAVVAAPGISRQEAAAMGDADLEARIGVEHAAENEMAHRHGAVERVADDVDEIMVGEAAPFGEAVGMQEDEHPELLGLGEEWPEARIGTDP